MNTDFEVDVGYTERELFVPERICLLHRRFFVDTMIRIIHATIGNVDTMTRVDAMINIVEVIGYHSE